MHARMRTLHPPTILEGPPSRRRSAALPTRPQQLLPSRPAKYFLFDTMPPISGGPSSSPPLILHAVLWARLPYGLYTYILMGEAVLINPRGVSMCPTALVNLFCPGPFGPRDTIFICCERRTGGVL